MSLGIILLVLVQEHVNQTLPGVEETLSVKVSSFIACPFSVLDHTASCPALNLSNGDITYTMDTSPLPVGTVATHTCRATFVLSGDTTRTCTNNSGRGMWSEPMLTCISKQSSLVVYYQLKSV